MTAYDRALADAYEAEIELSANDRLLNQVVVGAAIKDVPAPEPLIDGVLDVGSTAVLYGRSGSGKTFVALDWALSVAAGMPWCGRPTRCVPVLYLAAEGFAGLGQRVEAWERHHDGPVCVNWLPATVNLSDGVARESLAYVARELSAGLIVVDTLARCMVGSDENSARDMGVIVDNLERLRRETGATVLAVHHTGKNTDAGLRGSSALEAAVDTAIECSGTDGRLSLTARKQKHHPDGDVLERLRFVPSAESCVVDQDVAPVDEGINTQGRTMLRLLHETDTGNGLSNGEWRDLADAETVRKATFMRQLKVLLRAGLCIKHGTTARPRYSLSEQGLREVEAFGLRSVSNGLTETGSVGITVSPPRRGETSETDTSETTRKARDHARDAAAEYAA